MLEVEEPTEHQRRMERLEAVFQNADATMAHSDELLREEECAELRYTARCLATRARKRALTRARGSMSVPPRGFFDLVSV